MFFGSVRNRKYITPSEYRGAFNDREMALAAAMEARRFEIELYWTRTTYFSTFNAAAFAGYFVMNAAASSGDGDSDIGSFMVACIGVVLCVAWALANKGSKFWQENWENHVQQLGRPVLGPLFTTMLSRPRPERREILSQVLTGPSPYSVSKLNSIMSWYFVTVWTLLATIALPFVEWRVARGDIAYIGFGLVTVVFVVALFAQRSYLKDQEHDAWQIEANVRTPPQSPNLRS